jgi:tetratricopeptide (TPR) repeat protein
MESYGLYRLGFKRDHLPETCQSGAMRSIVLGIVLALAGSAVADRAKSPAIEILERAAENQKSKAALAAALAELDALIAKEPRNADAHYARGFVLSRSGKLEEAVAAYDKAFELDATLADAPYNAGVVLGRMGKPKEAVVRFDRALGVNKKHVDAAYNAGQIYYDLEDHAKAAARWETALKLAPEDFQIAKKLVQAYVALAKPTKVRAARARVFAMWKAGKDPDQSKTYVYDQFKAGKYHVHVYEAFDPSAFVFQAKIAIGDKLHGTITLEQLAITVDKAGERSTAAQFKKAPAYAVFKDAVKKLVGERF